MQTRVLLSSEMEEMRRSLMVMAARVEENLGRALLALRSSGEDFPQAVKDEDKVIDALQLKIEDMIFVLIATQQPVAGDLRELVTVFKITGNLERIGDYVVHLANAAEKMRKFPSFRSMEHIERMAETGQDMLKAAFSAFFSKDAQSARAAAALDDRIDEEHRLLTTEVLTFMKEKPELVKAASRLLKLSGYMERLGDHITNICECVIYMAQGTHEERNR